MELKTKDTCDVVCISKKILNCKAHRNLIHQVITAHFACKRKGTKSQKSRSEVSGSGRKPWRQKGTGRARVGSIRSPLWRSGGITFAAKERNYSQKLNKKMYRLALKGIFAELIRQNRLTFYSDFSVNNFKTKEFANFMKNSGYQSSTLIITEKKSQNLMLATRNLYNIRVASAREITPVHLISSYFIIATNTSVQILGDMLK